MKTTTDTTNNLGEDEKKMEPTPKEVPAPSATTPAQPLRRGFALMDRARVRAIARKGGVAAHEKGTAHQFTREEAKEAGRKGGRAPHKSRGKARTPKTAAPTTNGATGNGAPQSSPAT